jgi:hypothetical protein
MRRDMMVTMGIILLPMIIAITITTVDMYLFGDLEDNPAPIDDIESIESAHRALEQGGNQKND